MSLVICGALNFWNERPEDLDACVRGLANVADKIVALDGAYVRYPTATAHSPKDQIAAIRAAAKGVGLECLIVQPDRLWAGQVEKRSYLLSLATVGSNWFCTVDADHVIHTDREMARQTIRHIPIDVVSVPYVTPPNPTRPLADSAVGQWHADQMAEPQFIPHLFRSLPGFRVERFHWWYSAMKNGIRTWVWGGDGSYPTMEAQRFRRGYEIEHRTMMRTPKQIKLSRAFLNDREEIVRKTGQEDALPGMPPPKYNYGSVPW